MDKREQDITYNSKPEGVISDDDTSRRDGSDNSYSVINPAAVQAQEPQENFYYDELDRKCTLKKTSTIGSKIILHRQRTHYKGRKIFDISTALLGLIGIVLLVIFIIVCSRKGWSKSNLYDIDSGNRTALLLQSIFVIFVAAIGLLGSFTYWKPIILMVSLLSALAFVSHCYVAKQFLDVTRFAERDMAKPWWDTYSDENIMALEEEYNCCGYLNYKDHGFASKNCPKDLVVYTVPEDVYKAANVKKNDTYKRKFWKENSGQTTTTTTTTTPAGNTGNTANTDTTANTTAGTTADTTADTGVDTTTNPTNETDGNVGVNEGGDEGNDEGGDEGNDEGDGAMEKRSINVIQDDASSDVMDKIGEDIKNSITNGKGKIFLNISDKEKRQVNDNGATTAATTESNIPGCQRAIADKVKSGVTPLYIALFIFLIVYVVVFASSIVYWLDLRNEKEYDEFS